MLAAPSKKSQQNELHVPPIVSSIFLWGNWILLDAEIGENWQKTGCRLMDGE